MADPNSRLVYSTGGELPQERPERSERPAAQAQAAGAEKGVRLRLERRASGRLVTLLTGLGRQPGLADLLKRLKAACGAGGTLKDGVMELQGDQREKVEAELAARGIRSKRAGG